MTKGELLEEIEELEFDSLDEIWRVLYTGLLGLEYDSGEIIRDVLARHKDANLSSKEARQKIADEILGEV